LTAFAEQYKREFGFTVSDRAVIADDIRYSHYGIIRSTHFQESAASEPASCLKMSQNSLGLTANRHRKQM
jgi:dTDP-4-dehydrorhamnose 3,5-epimerase-like enzyme